MNFPCVVTLIVTCSSTLYCHMNTATVSTSHQARDTFTLQCTAADGATTGGTRPSFLQLLPVKYMYTDYTHVQTYTNYTECPTQQSTNSSNKDVASLSHPQRTPVWKYLRVHAPQGVGKV